MADVTTSENFLCYIFFSSSKNTNKPLYQAKPQVTCTSSIGCFFFLQDKVSKIHQYFVVVFNKIIIPLALAVYEMIIVTRPISSFILFSEGTVTNPAF